MDFTASEMMPDVEGVNMKERSKQPEPDDSEILRLLVEDRKENFDLVVITYNNRLIAFARTFVKDEAEDVVQEVMSSTYSALQNEQAWPSERILEWDLCNWLFKSVKNGCSRVWRTAKSQEILPTDEDIEMSRISHLFAISDGIPEKVFERKKIQVAIKRAIERLQLRYQKLAWLRDVEGRRYEEIAQMLGKNGNTLRVDHTHYFPVLQALLLVELRNCGEDERADSLEEHLKREEQKNVEKRKKREQEKGGQEE